MQEVENRIPQEARDFRAPDNREDEDEDINLMKAKLGELKQQLQAAKEEEQRYEQQQFSQQPHFHGIVPGSRDAELLAQSRGASKDLMKMAAGRAKKLQDEIMILNDKIHRKENPHKGY